MTMSSASRSTRQQQQQQQQQTLDSPPQNPYEFTREEYNALVKNTPNAHVSQRSEYDEIELVEDCTLYDLYRQPRAPVTDPSATKTLPVRVLNAELTCPICLCVIQSTMVVMECLHRFCGDCIQKCLRVGNKECPSCRIHIPSKRSLRRDENFDALIRKIYPDLAKFEREEAKLIEEINRTRHYNNALTESAKAGVENQEKLRRLGGKKKAAESSPPSSVVSTPVANGAGTSSTGLNGRDKRSAPPHSASTDSSSGSTSHSEDEDLARKRMRHAGPAPSIAKATVSSTPTPAAAVTRTTQPPLSSSSNSTAAAPTVVHICVLLHPEEREDAPRLQTNVFATPTPLKIASLKRQIARFLQVSSYDHMKVVLPRSNCNASGLTLAASTPGSGVVIRKDLLFDQELEDYMTIDDLYQQYRMGTDWQLVLYYHFSDAIINGVAQFISASSK